MGKNARARRAKAALEKRLSGVVHVSKGKYLCEDCGETRSSKDRGEHWSNRRGTICRGRPAKHGRFNAVDRQKIKEAERINSNISQYPTETINSVKPVYIGKHKQ